MAIREVMVKTKTRDEAVAIVQKCIGLGIKPYHGDGTADKAVVKWEEYPYPAFDAEGDLVGFDINADADIATEDEFLAHAAHIAAIQA